MTHEQQNGVSTREHVESIMSRLEDMLREQIKELKGQLTDLRVDLKHMQANYITRSEHELVVKVLREEIDRVDRTSRAAISDHEADTDRTQTKVIAVATLIGGVVVGITQVVVSIFM